MILIKGHEKIKHPADLARASEKKKVFIPHHQGWQAWPRHKRHHVEYQQA